MLVLGVVGWVCTHGVPLQGLFTNMPTPEQFAFYLLGLERLVAVTDRLDVSDTSVIAPVHACTLRTLTQFHPTGVH